MKHPIWLALGLMAICASPTGVFAGSTTSDASGFGVDPCYKQCQPLLGSVRPQSEARREFKTCMNTCQSGGGTPAVSSTAAKAYGPDTCANGYVWREAIPSDHVCVTPGSRSTARQENRSYRSLIDVHGASGSNSCISGYVWREAFSGDAVCVTPDRRSAVRQENAEGPSHVAS
jgi:hypothetical protein